MDYITDDLICRGIGFLVIAALVIAIYYWRFVRHGYEYTEHEKMYFDLNDPVEEYEYRCITEQRRYGRERGGPLILKDDQPSE